MGFGETITVLFIIAAVVWLRAQKYKDRNGSGGDGTFFAKRRGDPEVEREIENLRERIAVLERIATDDRQESDLERQIERLRN